MCFYKEKISKMLDLDEFIDIFSIKPKIEKYFYINVFQVPLLTIHPYHQINFSLSPTHSCNAFNSHLSLLIIPIKHILYSLTNSGTGIQFLKVLGHTCITEN